MESNEPMSEGMDEAYRKVRETGYVGELAISNYNGKFIVTAKEGTCEGCGEEDRIIHFFFGSWLCDFCVCESIVEDSKLFDEISFFKNEYDKERDIHISKEIPR